MANVSKASDYPADEPFAKIPHNMIHTLPFPQNLIIGIFLVLAAGVFAVAPLPLIYRSLGILFLCYLALSVGGTAFAYLAALVTPPLGLLSADPDWLIMLPIVMSSTLLAVLGVEFAWRYLAIIISPLLAAAPHLIGSQLAEQSLFTVTLPWEPVRTWVALHLLVALAGVIVIIYYDRLRVRRQQTS